MRYVKTFFGAYPDTIYHLSLDYSYAKIWFVLLPPFISIAISDITMT